mgnify:CR=1 FL=1
MPHGLTPLLTARPGLERMIVHCELDLGMRRCEVERLKVSDFQSGRPRQIFIHGKGRNGGKYRSISWHPQTEHILNEFLEFRGREIEKAREKDPMVKIPGDLLLYERGGKLQAYKKTAIDNILEDISARVGFKFSNHDLRRTCGRMMYRGGVKIEEIARIFGHSDTRTTMRYLGLDMEDMSSAMGRLAAYQASTYFPKTETNILSQEKSGQSGI